MPDTEDQKVTLAVLDTKLDMVLKTLDGYALDHDRIGKIEGYIERNTTAIGRIEVVVLAADARTRAMEIQIARMGMLYGVLGGSVSAAVTMVISKALGL